MSLPKVEQPTYSLKLPLSGMTVDYRPYLVKEEKIMMIAVESEDIIEVFKAIHAIVEACTFGKVDVRKLPITDLEFLFMHLKAKSVGSKTNIMCKCPHCNEDNQVTVEVSAAYVTPSTLPNNISITPTMGVVVMPPTFGLTVDLATRLTRNELKNTDVIYLTYVNSIKTIWNGDEVYDAEAETEASRSEFFEALIDEQSAPIREYIDNMPKVQLPVAWKCVKCNKDVKKTIEGLQNFF